MMQPKFINYHVGSRDVGIGFRILPAFSGDIVNILFDADIDSVAHTKAAWSRTAECETRVFPYCLSNAQRTERLHINFDAFTSSIFPFNTEYGDFYTYYDAGQVDYVLGESVRTMERRTVSTQTLDGLLERDEFRDVPPDFLSIDTQGAEYRILQGAREALRDCVLGLLVEVEFVPIYQGQELFADIQRLLEAEGFRLTAIMQHEEFSPFRGPIGARAGGFVLSGEALFLRRWETLKPAVPDVDRRYLMLHKLAFISVMFERLEYALLVLDAAKRLSPSPWLVHRLEERPYFVFLHQMLDAVAALPAAWPRTMAEAMTFEQAQARFKV
jgi:FkbM family methyltransferase